MSSKVENCQEKMYEFESNMKNNLIFYGIPNEERETPDRLLMKMKDVIRTHMKIVREINITSTSRMFTGPEVQGCRPVLVNFENFKDREDVLQASKCNRRSVISVTEDFSKKTRECRQELRKFLRHVKKNNPEKRCFLQYDKLFIDGKIFVYNEMTGMVSEQESDQGGPELEKQISR